MIEAALFDWSDTLVATAEDEGPTVLASAQALLEALRSRGIGTGIVATADPRVESFGLADAVDAVTVGGDRLLRACRELGVEPSATMFVGDDLHDVQDAANVGMTTVQALWFRADDTPGVEPDFMAFTPMDVLNALRRLAP